MVGRAGSEPDEAYFARQFFQERGRILYSENLGYGIRENGYARIIIGGILPCDVLEVRI